MRVFRKLRTACEELRKNYLSVSTGCLGLRVNLKSPRIARTFRTCVPLLGRGRYKYLGQVVLNGVTGMWESQGLGKPRLQVSEMFPFTQDAQRTRLPSVFGWKNRALLAAILRYRRLARQMDTRIA